MCTDNDIRNDTDVHTDTKMYTDMSIGNVIDIIEVVVKLSLLTNNSNEILLKSIRTNYI